MRVHRLNLGHVQLPEHHPRAAERTCPIFGFAIDHPDGVVLFDTGCGSDHVVINEIYRPTVPSILDRLHQAQLDERDVSSIVNSHLHFDHCGQNNRFTTVPIWVQRAELDTAATVPHYTVPEWADIPVARRRVPTHDVEEIAPGIQLIATPGHTPGHQSLIIDDPGGPIILGGQVCYTCAEFTRGIPATEDMHEPALREAGIDSIRRLAAFDPSILHLAHDRTPLLN